MPYPSYLSPALTPLFKRKQSWSELQFPRSVSVSSTDPPKIFQDFSTISYIMWLALARLLSSLTTYPQRSWEKDLSWVTSPFKERSSSFIQNRLVTVYRSCLQILSNAGACGPCATNLKMPDWHVKPLYWLDQTSQGCLLAKEGSSGMLKTSLRVTKSINYSNSTSESAWAQERGRILPLCLSTLQILENAIKLIKQESRQWVIQESPGFCSSSFPLFGAISLWSE